LPRCKFAAISFNIDAVVYKSLICALFGLTWGRSSARHRGHSSAFEWDNHTDLCRVRAFFWNFIGWPEERPHSAFAAAFVFLAFAAAFVFLAFAVAFVFLVSSPKGICCCLFSLTQSQPRHPPKLANSTPPTEALNHVQKFMCHAPKIKLISSATKLAQNFERLEANPRSPANPKV
jgi:hypothetical protein